LAKQNTSQIPTPQSTCIVGNTESRDNIKPTIPNDDECENLRIWQNSTCKKFNFRKFYKCSPLPPLWNPYETHI